MFQDFWQTLYADDSTIYASDINAKNVINKLESVTSTVAGWFKNNCMKLNGDKCHFVIFGDESNDLTIQIETTPIAESREETLFRLKIVKKNSHTRLRNTMSASIYLNATTVLLNGCSVIETWKMK